ncbi:hypothetical protein LVJ85_11325 [Neisseria sp. Dent CA1/247]|uniref:hypothetical protein n=1 Tax=Neisseria sp. Dent CA1/247 TaxID=2912675 RepID=UPI001FD2DF7C|nr:hypothetical protein [Neisseria sp. Dent CA1/247]UOO76583.1 hypothetical protein LVJ85_11325 [Neisseria sp. Dent CA1/247]
MQSARTLALENFSHPVSWAAKPNAAEELNIFLLGHDPIYVCSLSDGLEFS